MGGVCTPLRRWTFSTVRTERGKRSGAHVLALNQSLNLKVEKAIWHTGEF